MGIGREWVGVFGEACPWLDEVGLDKRLVEMSDRLVAEVSDPVGESKLPIGMHYEAPSRWAPIMTYQGRLG